MSGTLTQALRTTPRKKWVKRSLIALLIIILALLLGVGFYVWSIGHTWDSQTQKFDSITDSQDGLDNLKKSLGDPPAAPTFTGPEGKDPKSLASEKDQNGDGILDTVEGGKTRDIVDSPGTDILLLGSDSRAGSADAAKVSGQRADTIMLMHIPKDGSGVYLISIMRDSWVNIPGYGSAKVNAALNYGGIGLQVATIEQLLGIKIDHVAEIDFTGFKDLTNAVGGVDVQVPVAFKTGVWSYTPGTMHMDGSTALAFVRERYSFAAGDYQRVRNQRAYLRGLYNTLKTQGALSSIGKFKTVVDSLSGYLTVDKGLDSSQVANLAAPVITNGSTAMHMMSLPNAGPGWSMDGQSIVLVDQKANADLTRALQNDMITDFTSVYGED
ncbi:LytR family transcriptional regulator [Rothia sp. HSID18069]|uniref:LCP family protein n=1 Tax=Rothia sp. HSID18069 TaxID=2419515 RepID=UPI000F89C714|nr:LCP family protein [Rothia sp. HSID18069]RUP73548.1 LytR family transcriptional regulator [Rothia sp. HSID18069]